MKPKLDSKLYSPSGLNCSRPGNFSSDISVTQNYPNNQAVSFSQSPSGIAVAAVSSSVVTGDAGGAGGAGSLLSLSDEHADATSTETSCAASAVKIFVFIAGNLRSGYILRFYKGRFPNHRQPATGSLFSSGLSPPPHPKPHQEETGFPLFYGNRLQILGHLLAYLA